MTRRILIIGIMLFGIFTLAGCAAKKETEGETGGYRKITAEEAKDMMDSEDEIIIVDVRTRKEYEEKHIEGAVLIPNEEIGDEMPDELSDKEQTILIYCRSGNRSRQAAEKLAGMGYENIYDFGGINDWPYGTVSE